MNYIEFASKISFFEFLQSEFKEPHFKVSQYIEEINLLKKKITVEYLSHILGTHPKVIDIFEEILQLQRFTNTQYINFCFDVNVLNNYSEDLIIRYIENRVFNFENGLPNEEFQKIYAKRKKNGSMGSKEIIFNVKKSIVEYVKKCIENRDIFYHHLRNSIESRLRVAKYLIEHLNAEKYLTMYPRQNIVLELVMQEN